MRFSTTTLLALAAPLLAFAQTNGTSSEPNAFNNPLGGYAPSAGQVTTINWNPTTSGTVSIILRSGAASNLIAGTVVASSIPNSGSFDWTVPSDITRGSDYALEIVDDANPTVVNFTPQFVIESPNTVATTTNPVTLGAMTSSAASGSVSSASDSSATGSASDTAASASTTGSMTGSSTGSASGSMTTSASGSASSRAASASASASDAVLTTSSQAAGARATAMAGMLGVVALGALAL